MHIVLIVYVLGVVAYAGLLYWALNQPTDDMSPEAEEGLRFIEGYMEQSGLRKSGISILLGFLWPMAVYSIVTGPFRKK